MIKHGGDIYSKAVKLDFSANINPLGMPPGVRAELTGHIDDFEKYPDPRCTELKKAIAKREGVSAENVVCGGGAADLIYRIVRVLSPKRALVPAPTFGEYEKALTETGCRVRRFMLDEKADFGYNESVLSEIEAIDILFLCSPNNPTGGVVDGELLKNIAEKCRKIGCVLVLDECFLDFAGGCKTAPLPENVIVLKAFTKIYAMPGLRLGYALCSDAETIRKIEDCGQCWSVSVPAQLAGLAALREEGYVEKTVRLISKERKYLTNGLKRLGLKVYPSEANFILFRCSVPLEKPLLGEGIAVRACEDFVGLGPDFYRIAVRTREENAALIRIVERVVKWPQ